MKHLDTINNSKIEFNSTIYSFFLRQQYGFSVTFIRLLEKRLEVLSFKTFFFFSRLQWLGLYCLIRSVLPMNSSIKSRELLSIYFFDLLSMYKGWRHLKGLPVRGQRTWTNAWSTYKSNLQLRNYKLLLAKRIYGNMPANELTVAYLAEQINLMWKLQWESEWRTAKKKQLSTKNITSRATKVDLHNMSKGNVVASKSSSKKSKSSLSKNYLTLGFDPGFTKFLLRSSLVQNKFANSGAKVILSGSSNKHIKKKR